MVSLYRTSSHFGFELDHIPDGSIIRSSGSYADSWSLVPDMSWKGQSVKAKVHLSKVVSSFLGRGDGVEEDKTWMGFERENEVTICSPIVYGVYMAKDSPHMGTESKSFRKDISKNMSSNKRASAVLDDFNSLHSVSSGLEDIQDNTQRLKAMKKYVGYGNGAEQGLSARELEIAAEFGDNPVARDWRYHGGDMAGRAVAPDYQLAEVHPGEKGSHPADVAKQVYHQEVSKKRDGFFGKLGSRLAEKYGQDFAKYNDSRGSNDPELPNLGLPKFKTPADAFMHLFSRIGDLVEDDKVKGNDIFDIRESKSHFDPSQAAMKYDEDSAIAGIEKLVSPQEPGSTMWSYYDVDTGLNNLVDGGQVVAKSQGEFGNARNGAWTETDAKNGNLTVGYRKGKKVFAASRDSFVPSQGDRSFWFVEGRHGGQIFRNGEPILNTDMKITHDGIFHGIGQKSFVAEAWNKDMAEVFRQNDAGGWEGDVIPYKLDGVSQKPGYTDVSVGMNNLGVVTAHFLYNDKGRVFQNGPIKALPYAFKESETDIFPILEKAELGDTEVGEMLGMKAEIASKRHPAPLKTDVQRIFVEHMNPENYESTDDYWRAVEHISNMDDSDFLEVFMSLVRRKV
jgi:hypothetical protein